MNILTLQQIRVGDEYRYRDEATGRVYTAVEARQIKGPSRVKYLRSDPLTMRGAVKP